MLYKQKLGKTPDPDNIPMEALMCAGHRVCIHLRLLILISFYLQKLFQTC